MISSSIFLQIEKFHLSLWVDIYIYITYITKLYIQWIFIHSSIEGQLDWVHNLGIVSSISLIMGLRVSTVAVFGSFRYIHSKGNSYSSQYLKRPNPQLKVWVRGWVGRRSPCSTKLFQTDLVGSRSSKCYNWFVCIAFFLTQFLIYQHICQMSRYVVWTLCGSYYSLWILVIISMISLPNLEFR